MNDSSSAQITSYANSTNSAVSAYFTPPEEEESGPVPFKNIVTTLMTDMSSMFRYLGLFNKDISSWDTSNVSNMFRMFFEASAFNQNIGSWDTSKVTDMLAMFANISAFNNGGSPTIGNWNTAKVTNMGFMFYNSTSFNQNISGWNVALTTARPSLIRTDFATLSPLALPENSHKLPQFV